MRQIFALLLLPISILTIASAAQATPTVVAGSVTCNELRSIVSQYSMTLVQGDRKVWPVYSSSSATCAYDQYLSQGWFRTSDAVICFVGYQCYDTPTMPGDRNDGRDDFDGIGGYNPYPGL